MKRLLTLVFILTIYMSSITAYAQELDSASADKPPVKICIDPGHGGENLGAEWGNYTEKEMTLIVASAMKEELEKYEGIEVYMTRTSDTDMELSERIDYAAEVGADFFFCLHFNMSVNHDIYGTENWISAFGKNYARGMDFAKIEMELLTDLGLYDRGIKTRLGKKGQNYYGVLRLGDEAGLPGVIIEHCHLDNKNDEPYYDHNDWLVEYGKLDATAVAKYYGLYSPELGNDYRNYTYEPTPIPDGKVAPDYTEPDYCNVQIGETIEEEITDENGKVYDYRLSAPISISAYDADSRMLYYSISFDGGNTFSERYPWRGDTGEVGETINTTIELPYDRNMDIVVNAYNLYDLLTPSESVHINLINKPEIQVDEPEESEEELKEEYQTISPYDESATGEDEESGVSRLSEDKTLLILVIALLVAALVVVLFAVYFAVELGRHNKRKKRRHSHKRN